MKEPAYPLQQIVEVKKRRVEEAEKVVMEKKRALEKEQKKMAEVEAARDEVLHHYQDKLSQLRQVLDEGSNSTTIRQMKEYLKIVKDKLEKEEIKVKEQQKQVDAAIKNLEAAQKILRDKRQEADKLDIHKEQWTKETKTEMRKEEEKQQDEVGTTIFTSQQMKKKPK